MRVFGNGVVGTDGTISSAVDADIKFTIMSVSKPFIVFALVCDLIRPEVARAKVGASGAGYSHSIRLRASSSARTAKRNAGQSPPLARRLRCAVIQSVRLSN
ncbi:glutaminase [Bradyrhizobium sp. AZCC 1678]|uniref:glutaminase n=1 Tax=Bradyrhizobium sp. AZCC 1678 TaxID=3117030 RepID=UPI003FA575B2